MAESLKIYNFVTGVDDPYFHNEDEPILVTSFTYTANRMGGVQLTASFYHKDQLDDLWDGKQYVIFRGEKYFVKQVPSSTKDTSSDRYKYDVTFKSERSKLDDIYFFDVVTDDTDSDRYQSNNTNVVFFGDVHEFAKRLNYSLKYSGLDYTVVVDEDVTSESKYVQFEDKFISEALQEIYNTYDVPYYFDGKTIHIGYTNNAIAIPFAYGANRELMSISKTNANYRIVNRCSGVGSSDNIPFYYPNKSEKGTVHIVCPGTNTGIKSEDVVIFNNNMLGSNLSLADNLQYIEINRSGIFESISITDNVTKKEFVNGTLIKSEWYKYLTSWRVSVHDLIVKFEIKIEENAIALVTINTNYKAPVAYLSIPGVSSGIQVQRTLEFYPTYQLSKNGGSSYEDIGTTFQLDTSGTYYIKMSAYFGEVSDTVFGSPNKVSDYSISISLGKESRYNAWTLNGHNEILLGEYGIELKDGATPAVGDIIGISEDGDFIRTTGKLMPSIYLESGGKERFYNALNNTYEDGEGGYLHFDNEYTEDNPKEQIVEFDDIKPTIAGITNAAGVRIDQIADIAFDDDDSDETNEDGEYLHPYFYVKLNKFDGEWGFNLFDRAIVNNTAMTLSLTSGNCSAANFEIAVVETEDGRFLNPVQVDDNGDIVPGGRTDKINEGNIQKQQQDTSTNAVWLALKKDDNTFGVIIPNATNNYKPSVGDNFVLLYIDMPEEYKRAAEKRLDAAIIKYMLENNNSKFNFSLKFSRIFFAENPDILAQVNENARIILEYDNKEFTLYISTYTYTVKDDEDLPEITVDLKDTITVVTGTIEQMVSSVVGDTVSGLGISEPKDTLASNTRYFLRKDTPDTARKRITFTEGATFGSFSDMLGGAAIDIDPNTGQSLMTVDKLKVRLKAYFEELTIIRTNSIGGKHIITPAGSIVCTDVEETSDKTAYRCYFANSQDGQTIVNMFVVGDLAICESFNVMSSNIAENVTNKYYWREVVGIGTNYIDLSKTKCDEASDMPQSGDVICQLGNISDTSRQGAIVLSAVESDAPSITLYSGIDTYSYAGKDYIRFGVNDDTNEPFLAVYGNMFFGDRDLSDPDATYITYQQKEGDTRKKVYIKADVIFGAGSEGLSNLSEWQDMEANVSSAIDAASNAEQTANSAQQTADDAARKANEAKDYIDNTLPVEIADINKRLDGVVENWFYPYSPTLENEPAVSWINDGEQAQHVGDTFTNTQPYVDDSTTPDAGKSWRWVNEDGSYKWTVIADSDAVKALQEAAKAQDTADSKRRVFTVEPTTPYDVGDIWTQGPNGDIMRCIKSRMSGTFDLSDWDLASKYTDDTTANEAKSLAESVSWLKDIFGNMTTEIMAGAILTGFVGTKSGDKVVAALTNGESGLPFIFAGCEDIQNALAKSKFALNTDGTAYYRDLANKRLLKISTGGIEYKFGDYDELQLRQIPDTFKATPNDNMLFSNIAQSTTEDLVFEYPQFDVLMSHAASGGAVDYLAFAINMNVGNTYSSIVIDSISITTPNVSALFGRAVWRLSKFGTTDSLWESDGVILRPNATITAPGGTIPYNSLYTNSYLTLSLIIKNFSWSATKLIDPIPAVSLTVAGAKVVLGGNVSRSAYENTLFGNGFFYARSATVYVGAMVDSTGAYFEQRSGNYGVRMTPSGQFTWCSDVQEWRPIGSNKNLRKVSYSTTLTSNDQWVIITASSVSITMPANPTNGQCLYFKQHLSSPGGVKLVANTGQTINPGNNGKYASWGMESNGKVFVLIWNRALSCWEAYYTNAV